MESKDMTTLCPDQREGEPIADQGKGQHVEEEPKVQPGSSQTNCT